MGFFGFLTKSIETKDMHSEQAFRTHYYKNDYRQVKDSILSYAKQNNYQVSHVDDQYGEILIETSSFMMIVTIKKASAFEVSVDIKVSFNGILGLYRPHKMVKDIFAFCDKQLVVRRIGLQP